MKIAVVGTIMLDEIYPYAGERRESFGGILYNVLAFAHLLGPQDRVCPVCYVGEEQGEQILDRHFRGFPNIDASGMRVSPRGNDRNTIRYVTPEKREEKMTLATPVIGMDQIEAFLDSDLILINFINSRDTDLATVKALRRRGKGILAMDVHNATRRLTPEGRLILREGGFREGLEWGAQVDVLQANEEEVAAVTGIEVGGSDPAIRAAKRLLEAGPRHVIVTLGSAGSCLAYRKDGRAWGMQVPAYTPEKVVDPTGCGDSFGAAFLCGILEGRSAPLSVLRASVIAGLNAEFPGVEGLKKAGEATGRMREAFPDLLRRIESGWPGEPL